jgi:hypothetical protein
MLDNVQLKQRYVIGCGAWRGGRLLAFHDFTVSQFPGGVDIVMACCPAAHDEGSDRFAKNPIRCGSLAHLAFVNLRSNPVNDEDRGAIGHIENRRCARWRLLRGGRLRPGGSERDRGQREQDDRLANRHRSPLSGSNARGRLKFVTRQRTDSGTRFSRAQGRQLSVFERRPRQHPARSPAKFRPGFREARGDAACWSGSWARRPGCSLDRLATARTCRSAQCYLRIRPVFSHSLWKRNCGQPVVVSRSHGWR